MKLKFYAFSSQNTLTASFLRQSAFLLLLIVTLGYAQKCTNIPAAPATACTSNAVYPYYAAGA